MTARRLASVPDEPPRAVGYVRVSMAREEMISPELQRRAIEDYCARRGYVLENVIEDLDATGRNFVRAGVQQAIERVEGAGVAVVVVWKFSRFGRDRKGWAVNLDRVETAGGRLESATEELDASTSTGRFTRGMLAEIAAWESERTGDQWREAHARRLARGLPHSGRPRFGYTYSKDDGYQPDPATAPVVVELYQRFIRGESVRSLVRWLNRSGVPTATGGVWSTNTLYRLLDAGFPAGYLWVRAGAEHRPGAHPPLIDAKTWEAFLRVRRQGRKDYGWSRHPVTSLAGLVRCGGCGGPMRHGTLQGRNGKKRYQYRCGAAVAGLPCPAPATMERHLVEAEVRAWVQRLAAELEESARAAAARLQAVGAAKVDRDRHRREIVRAERQLLALTEDRAAGIVEAPEYVAARDSIRARKAEHEAALLELDDEVTLLARSHRPVVTSLARAWDDLDMQGRRDALRALLRRVEVRREKPRVRPVPVWEREQ